MNRYQNIQTRVDPHTHITYRNPPTYPYWEESESLYVYTQAGDRLDMISKELYNTDRYWWILGAINELPRNQLILRGGLKLRVLADPEAYVQAYEAINQ